MRLMLLLLSVVGVTFGYQAENPNWKVETNNEWEAIFHHTTLSEPWFNYGTDKYEGFQIVLPKPDNYVISSNDRGKGAIAVSVTKENAYVVVVAPWATRNTIFYVETADGKEVHPALEMEQMAPLSPWFVREVSQAKSPHNNLDIATDRYGEYAHKLTLKKAGEYLVTSLKSKESKPIPVKVNKGEVKELVMVESYQGEVILVKEGGKATRRLVIR